MCKRHKYKLKPNSRIDKCLRSFLPIKTKTFVTLASCCGHGVYPPTIVIKDLQTQTIFELLSSKILIRKKRFYVRDQNGFYFIPECLQQVFIDQSVITVNGKPR